MFSVQTSSSIGFLIQKSARKHKNTFSPCQTIAVVFLSISADYMIETGVQLSVCACD